MWNARMLSEPDRDAANGCDAGYLQTNGNTPIDPGQLTPKPRPALPNQPIQSSTQTTHFSSAHLTCPEARSMTPT